MKKKTADIFSKNNIYFQLFANFFKIGMFTIGGGLAMTPLIQREVVENKRWLTKEEMVDCLAVAQSLPGVVAINTATYVGNFKKGAKGAFASTVGVILPSIIVILIIASVLTSIGDNPFVEGALYGIKGAAVGMISYSTITMGKAVLKNWLSWAIAVTGFCMVLVFEINAIWVIIAGIVFGALYTFFKRDQEVEK